MLGFSRVKGVTMTIYIHDDHIIFVFGEGHYTRMPMADEVTAGTLTIKFINNEIWFRSVDTLNITYYDLRSSA